MEKGGISSVRTHEQDRRTNQLRLKLVAKPNMKQRAKIRRHPAR